MIQILKSLLPASLFEKLKYFYKEYISHYQRVTYSEFGEDLVAAVLLGFKKGGTYIDIGAFGPKELSATYLFYKKLKWSGLVIEPNPSAKKRFLGQRPRDTFVNCGVSANEGELTYYKFENPTYNSFDPEMNKLHAKLKVGEEKISVKPLSVLIEENLPNPSQVDLINIDVEGLEMEVLKSNDWSRCHPKVLIIEDHQFNPEDPLKSELVQFLKSKSYVLKANCLISLIFMKIED